MQHLPNGNVLLVLNGSLAAPLAGARLVELDLATGAVVPWGITGFPTASSVNALAVRAGSIYLGEFTAPQRLGRVWHAPLPNLSGPRNITVSPVTTLGVMGGVMSLDFDNSGRLVVGTFGAGGIESAWPFLHRVDLQNSVVTDLLPGAAGVANAVLVETNTDSASAESLFWAGVRCNHAQGGVTASLVPAMTSFGSASTCGPVAMDYRWLTAPNLGGLPLAGSTTFSLRVDRVSAQPHNLGDGWFAMGLDKSAAPIPLVQCATLLLDPGSLFASFYHADPILSQSSVLALPLPLPANPLLVGQTFHVQTLHRGVTGNEVHGSPGLSVTIL